MNYSIPEDRALRSLIETLGVVVFRAHGNPLCVDFVGPAAERVLGKPASELVGDPSHLALCFHPEDRSEVLSALRIPASSADGQAPPRRCLLRARPRQGAPRHYLQLEVHPEAGGASRAVAGYIVDVAEASLEIPRSLRERESWLQLIVGQLPVIVWTVDTELRLTSLGGTGTLSLGMESPESWVGRPIAELAAFVGVTTSSWSEAHRRAFQGEIADYADEARGRAFRVRVAPFRDAGAHVIGAIGAGIDVSETVRAQGEAQRAERALGELVDNVQGIVWRSEYPGFRFQFVSKQAERLLGYPLEQWLEPGFWIRHLHPEDRAGAIAFCELQVSRQRPHDFEYRMYAADGRVVWIRDLVSVVPHAPSGYLLSGIMVDITRQKELEQERASLLNAERAARASAQEAERRQAFLAEAGRILAATLDYDLALRRVARLAIPDLADWCVVDAVTSAGEVRTVAMAHRDPALQAAGERLYDVTPTLPWPPHAPRQERVGKAYLARELNDEDLAVICIGRPDLRGMLGTLQARSAIAAGLEARGRHLGQIYLVYGSSGRRYLPADAALLAELADRAALAVDNARLYQESQQAVRTRDEFLAVASHELRTPCTALQLGVQRLRRLAQRRNLSEVSPDLLRGILDSAQRQTRRLATLVENLLDAANLGPERMRLRLERIDLAAVAREVATDAREELRRTGSGLSLYAEQPVVGRWDRVRLVQVVSHLLANAIKYGEGRPIDLAVQEDREVARLQVVDRGMGIPPDHQATVFEPFARAVSASHYGGLGLGLFIVKRTVSALGGEIALESEPGKGTRITVLLPVAGPPAAEAGPRDDQAAAPPLPGSLL